MYSCLKVEVSGEDGRNHGAVVCPGTCGNKVITLREVAVCSQMLVLSEPSCSPDTEIAASSQETEGRRTTVYKTRKNFPDYFRLK